jgi:hypothetical protein
MNSKFTPPGSDNLVNPQKISKSAGNQIKADKQHTSANTSYFINIRSLKKNKESQGLLTHSTSGLSAAEGHQE